MSLDTTVTLIFVALGAVCCPYVFIDSRGGWPIFWYNLKKRFRRKK